MEALTVGDVGLALAWDGGERPARSRLIASVPLCWLGSSDMLALSQQDRVTSLPLVAMEAPCMLRSIACNALDRHGLPWRMSFVTPSPIRALGGNRSRTGHRRADTYWQAG